MSSSVRGLIDAEADACERGANIKVDVDGVALDGSLEVFEMLTVADTAVADNIQGNDATWVFLHDYGVNLEGFNFAGHGEVVVARSEDEFGEEGVADVLAIEAEVHGDVAQVERHDGGVVVDDVANHVGAVGEGLVASEELDIFDLHALEVVETWCRVSLCRVKLAEQSVDLPFISTFLS